MRETLSGDVDAVVIRHDWEAGLRRPLMRQASGDGW
jgi:hypothetical protein